MFENLLSISVSGGLADIFTIISSSKVNDNSIGKMVIIDDKGQIHGECEEELAQKIVDKIKKTVWSKPVVIQVQGQNDSYYRIYWDRLKSNNKAIIFGGGHISQPLAQIMSLLHFQVTVIDDRPEFANQARFPSVDKVICQNFSKAFSQINIDSDTAVIIVTRGHRYDLDCLRATINCNARYWGMIGSRRRVKEIVGLLKEEGISEERLKRLKSPIGLDIRAETPEEIAVSITAEVVSVFRGGFGVSLSIGEVII